MDILYYFFIVVAYFHIPLALLSFYFSFVLLKRGFNPITFNFGLSVLFLGLWVLITSSDIFRVSPFISWVHSVAAFVAGVWIMHFFLMFSYYYPVRVIQKQSKLIIFYIFTILISVFSVVPDYLVGEGTVDFPFRYRDINPIGLTAYTLYFGFISALAFYNLFKSYERSDGIFRLNLKKIIFGTFIAVVANLILSLVNFYYVQFDLTPVGVIFSFFVLWYIYRILNPKN